MKPSLYATLPVGTRVNLEAYFANPYGGWVFAQATVLEDLGGDIKVKADSGYATADEFTISKDRIRSIL